MTSIASHQVPLQGRNLQYKAVKTISDMTGQDTATLFTVTGDVWGRIVATVGGTAITCTSGTTTMEVGTSEDTNGLIATTTIENSSNFGAGAIWTDSSPTLNLEALSGGNYRVISDNGGNGDILLTISADDILGGALNFYFVYDKLSDNASVVPA